MKINKQITTVLLASGLLIGGLGSGLLLTPSPTISQAAPAQQADPAQSKVTQTDPIADTQDEGSKIDEVGDIDTVEEVGATDEGDDVDGTNETEGSDAEGNEADEADAGAPPTTGITAEEAQAIVEQANPNAKTVVVEFDRENGVDIFEAELDSGQDVKVNANDGTILATEVRDAN